MAQNYKTGLIITGDASGGIRAIKATEDELSKLNKGFDRSSRDSRRFGSDAQRAGQQVRGMGQDASEASKGLTLVRQAATLAAAAFSIRQLAVYADGWSEINSRVLNATKDLDVSEHTMKRLAETARGTYSSLNQTAEAYLNNATTLTELGYSTERQLDLSDALNNSLVISATRGQQAESVLQALSKAFAAGELRGDNFNTVIQSGGRIAEALADGLGVTTIQLREMAAAGELTTSRVFEALTSQMEVLRKEAEEMPATIADGWTLIGNSSMELVGRIDKAFGTSEGIAGIMVDAADAMTASIDPLIDNMGTIQDMAVLTATVVAGRYAAAFASSAKNVATQTAETYANAQANASATQAAARRTAAEKQSAMAVLSTARLEEQATRGTAAHALALDNLSRARTRAATAAGAHTAATAASDAAMQRSTVSAYAMAAASRAAYGALTLIGGPVGAAVLAGTAAYYFRDSLGFTSAAARDARQEIDQLVDSMDNYTHAQYQSNRVSIVQDLAEARIEAEKLEQQIAQLQEQSRDEGVVYQGRGGAASSQLSGLRAELQEQNRIVRANEEGLRKYDQAWRDVLESQVSGVSIFRTLDQWLMTTGDSSAETSRRFNGLSDTLGEAGEKWDDYIGKLQTARDVMGMTAAESAQYAAAQQGFTGLYAEQAAAVAGQTDALNDYQKAIADGNSAEAQAHLERAQRYAEAEAMVKAQLQNIGTLTSLLQGVQTELSATALSAALVVGDSSGAMAANISNAIQAINDRAAAIRQTTTVTVKNTAANREAQKAAREAEQAAQKQADALQTIQQEMDPLLKDHATYVERINVLEKALAAGTITQEDFAKAVRWSANQYSRAATGAEAYEKQTKSLIDTYDSHNQKAQKLRTELEQINQRYRAGDIDGQQYGRMVQGVRNEMAQLALEADPAAQEMARAWEEASNRIDETFADAFRGAFDSFDSFADQLQDGFKRLLAELAYQATLRPIVVGFTKDMRGLLGGGGVGGFANTIGAAQNLMNGSSLLGGASTAATAASAGGLYAGAATQTAGTLYGSVATGAAIGPAASAGIMSSITAGVSAAMPWIAGGLAIDGLLGGSISKGIGSAVSSIFGGSWKTKDGGLNLGVFGGDITGHQYEQQHKKGGWFSSSKSRTNTSALDSEFETALSQTYQAQELALRASLETLGQQSSVLNSFSAGLEKISTKGKSEAEVEQAVQEWLQNIVNRAAQSVVDPSQYALAGETTVETLNRLATALTGVNPLLKQLHGAGYEASLAGGDAAASLVALSGGMEQFAQRADYYYQHFYTEAERQEAAMTQAARAMGAFTARTGEIVTTTADLRALVDGIDRNSEAGRELYAAAMQLAPALVEVEQGLERVKDRFADMRNEAESALGSAEQQALSAWQAFDNQSFKQQITLLESVGDSQAALALQRERELLSIDPLLHETQRVIWSIEDEAQAKQNATQAAQRYVSELSRVRDQLSSTFGNIAQWVDQRNATSGAPGMNLAEAGDQFARQLILAQSGDRSALQSITQYADQYLTAGEAMYASGGAFQRIQQDVLDALQDLPDQISAEEFLADEIRAALFEALEGKATDSEINALMARVMAGDMSIESALASIYGTSEGTEDNTKTLEERARDQLRELNGLVGEMSRTTDQFVGLNSGINSLTNSINALGVAQAEVARIEKERAAAEKAERERIAQERIAAQEAAKQQQAQELINSGSSIKSSLEGFKGSAKNSVSREYGGWENSFENLWSFYSGRNLAGLSDQQFENLKSERREGHRASGADWAFGNTDTIANAIREMQQSQQSLVGLRQDYKALTGKAAPFANGGIFEQGRVAANSIVSSPTYFDMGLMGEADPEAVVPLSRGAGGRLGIDATGLMRVPDGQLELPMPNAPMPQFPALNNSDVLQILQDVKRELQETRKENKRLQEENNRHAAAAVAVQQAGFNRQINEQQKSNRALDDMSAAARLENSR